METVSKKQMELIREAIQQNDALSLEKSLMTIETLLDSDHWDLVSLLSQHIDNVTFQSAPVLFKACEQGLYNVITVGNPNELLLSLLEQTDTIEDVTKFQTFLHLVQTMMAKMTTRQQFSLELALETLCDCIKNLDLPKVENDEHDTYDFDADVEKAVSFLEAYLNFLQPFVRQISLQCPEKFQGEDAERQMKTLTKYLMLCFEHPVMQMDVMSIEKEGKQVISNVRKCVEKLVCLLQLLHLNLHEFLRSCIKWNNQVTKRITKRKRIQQVEGDVDGYDEQAEPVPVLALSCLSYLVYAEGMAETEFHSLYPMQSLLEQNLLSILLLMTNKHNEAKRKGVILLEVLLAKLDPSTALSYEELDRQEFFRIIDAIFDIMVHCPLREIRLKGVKIVPQLIQLFNLEGRYQIYVKLFQTLKHPGAYGFCIQLFKNQMTDVIKYLETGSTIAGLDYFTGLPLKRIVLLIIRLDEGPTTDLVENSDRIIAGLNFLRYMALRHQPEVDRTKIWNYMSFIESEFIKTLQSGLEISKAHYQLELTGLEEKSDKKISDRDEIETSLCVGGYKVPKMERGQRIAITKMALNTLELITSLVVRVDEVIDQQRKKTSE